MTRASTPPPPRPEDRRGRFLRRVASRHGRLVVAAATAFLLTQTCPLGGSARAAHRPVPPIDRASPAADSAARRRGLDLQAVARTIVSATNDFRSSRGRSSLKVDAKLDKAARDFADYMARTGRYGHTADGKRPADRVQEHGYAYCIVAENIAYAYQSSGFSEQSLTEEFVQGWIASPPHRENMLDVDLTEIGVGIARSPKTGYYYAVQDFGRPQSAAARFSVMNRSGRTLRYELDGRRYSLPTGASRTHTECRTPRLEFSLPRRKAAAGRNVFRPTSGERFVVTQSAGRLGIERRP